VTSLARRLGTFDAVVIGLGSMIGAGVFAAFAPAARSAGALLLVGLALAAGVAYCNAVASAQLAAQYPTSGGTYVYGRERLGEWWGFLAGFGFVVGKTASCAAMALTFAAYVVSGSEWGRRAVALAAVAVLTGANLRGISRTASLARVLVALTLVALGVVVAAIVLGGGAGWSNVRGWHGGVYGVLQSAGLLFFAFAGYARIATLGEEVREPERTIPRAIGIALAITLVVYSVVAVTALAAGGAALLASSTAPLRAVVDGAWAEPVVAVGAAVASAGVLLSLLVGVSRTVFAMAANGHLPRTFGAVHERTRVPHHAELAVGVVVAAVVLAADIRGAIGFSSFCVLVYYAIANASAFTLRQRRLVPGVGVTSCLLLAVTLPLSSVVAGAAVLAVGVGAYAIGARRR
jgi:APA family basic amino acid/polyamine antiporter